MADPISSADESEPLLPTEPAIVDQLEPKPPVESVVEKESTVTLVPSDTGSQTISFDIANPSQGAFIPSK